MKEPDWSNYEAQAYGDTENEKNFNVGALLFNKRVSRKLPPPNQKSPQSIYNSSLILNNQIGQIGVKDARCMVQMARQS